MRLNATERDRLTIFVAAELARRRRTSGLQLTYPEAAAVIADEMHEAARSGASYDEVVATGAAALTSEDVLEGVEALLKRVDVECLLDDGTRLVTVLHPIRSLDGRDQST